MKTPDTLLSAGNRCLIIVLGAFLLLAAMTGRTIGQKAPEGQRATHKTPELRTARAPQASGPIPVAEVATEATKVSDFLRALYTNLGPSHDIQAIQKELPNRSRRFVAAMQRTVTMLQAQPTLETLQTEEQLWQKNQLDMSNWETLLTERETQLQGALGRLADLHKRWSQSLD